MLQGCLWVQSSILESYARAHNTQPSTAGVTAAIQTNTQAYGHLYVYKKPCLLNSCCRDSPLLAFNCNSWMPSSENRPTNITAFAHLLSHHAFFMEVMDVASIHTVRADHPQQVLSEMLAIPCAQVVFVLNNRF